jgi:hypothetical protein
LLDTRSAISTLGAKAMSAMAPAEETGEGEEAEEGEEAPTSTHDFDSVVAAAEAAVEDDEAGEDEA